MLHGERDVYVNKLQCKATLYRSFPHMLFDKDPASRVYFLHLSTQIIKPFPPPLVQHLIFLRGVSPVPWLVMQDIVKHLHFFIPPERRVDYAERLQRVVAPRKYLPTSVEIGGQQVLVGKREVGYVRTGVEELFERPEEVR